MRRHMTKKKGCTAVRLLGRISEYRSDDGCRTTRFPIISSTSTVFRCKNLIMILPGASTTLKSTCHSLDKYKAKVSPEAKLRHPVAAACAGWCRRQTANAPRVHTHTQRQAHITRTHTHTLTPANMDARTDNHGDTHTHIYIYIHTHACWIFGYFEIRALLCFDVSRSQRYIPEGAPNL